MRVQKKITIPRKFQGRKSKKLRKDTMLDSSHVLVIITILLIRKLRFSKVIQKGCKFPMKADDMDQKA